MWGWLRSSPEQPAADQGGAGDQPRVEHDPSEREILAWRRAPALRRRPQRGACQLGRGPHLAIADQVPHARRVEAFEHLGAQTVGRARPHRYGIVEERPCEHLRQRRYVLRGDAARGCELGTRRRGETHARSMTAPRAGLKGLQHPAGPGEAFRQPAGGERQHVDALPGGVDRPFVCSSRSPRGSRWTRWLWTSKCAEPKNSRSPPATSCRWMRWRLGISPACSAAVRPRICLPHGRPESLYTRHAKPEQS